MREEDYSIRAQDTNEWRKTLKDQFSKHLQANMKAVLARVKDPNLPRPEQVQLGKIFQMSAHTRQAPKNIHRLICKAMALRSHFKPVCGFFITMTFNCACPEMGQMIGSQNPANNVTLCCRLATIKFRELLKLVHGPNGIFGPSVAYVWSREYQKRGNKHWHLVIMMDPKEKNPPFPDPNTPEYVDEFITCELPEMPDPATKDTDPLYQHKEYYCRMVRRQYVHDGCIDNPDAPCRKHMPDGKCRFGFPKPFADYTTVYNDGRGLTYRRRSPESGGASFKKKLAKGQERTIDNRYVVPHNRLLTMLFGCHICVEFVTQRDVWFYLFKYTHKEDPA
jgi:hypothetical protein